MNAGAVLRYTGFAMVALFSVLCIDAQTISPGTPTPVTISTPGQSAKFTFQGTAGQLASVELANSTFSTGCYGVIVSILNPSGSTLEADGTCSSEPLFLNTVTLPNTGSYTLVIAPQNNATGSATVTLSLFSTGTISPGSPKQVGISAAGETAQLSFSGTAGQLASVQLASSTFGECYSVSILNASGTAVESRVVCSKAFFLNGIALPASSAYTLVIAPQNGSTGSVVVTLWLFSEQTGATITPGTSVPITVNIPGQAAQMTFNGTVGQSVQAQLTGSSFNLGCYAVIVTILNPDGSTLTSTGTCSTALSTNIISLPVTGIYALVIAPQDGGTGSANAQITLWPSDGQVGTSVVPGVPWPASITPPAKDAQFTFNGTAGEFASVQISSWSFSCFAANMQILNPDGSQLTSTGGPCVGGGFVGPIALPSTGTYTIVFNSSTAGTAIFTLWLFQEQTGPLLVQGTPVTTTVNSPGQDTQVSFSGTKGQLATIQLATTFPGPCFNAALTILNPDGTALSSNAICTSGFVGPVTLPATGNYTVIVAPWGGGTGSVTLSLFLFQEVTGTQLSSGVPATANITSPGQNAQMTFAGTKGQLASVQYATPFPGPCFTGTISILNPDGTLLGSGYICGSGFVGPFTLPVTGTYTVVLGPWNDATGLSTITLFLFQVQIGSSLTSGTSTPANSSTPAQAVEYPFSATKGQIASAQITSSNFSGSVNILTPDGKTLTSAVDFGGNVFVGPVTIPATGTYTLVFIPSPASWTANVTLWLFQEQTGTTLTSGTAQSVNIQIPGQSAQLAFAGSAAQLATLQVTNQTFGGYFAPVVSILSPDGTKLASSDGTGTIGPFILPAAGNYAVTVVGDSNYNWGMGEAQITLSLATVGAIVPGTGLKVTINTAGQSAQYTFAGMAGQLATLQIANYSFTAACQNVAVSFIGANGSTLASGNACGSSLQNVTLPSTQQYMLQITPQGTGSATFTVSLSTEQKGSIQSGTQLPITIGTAGQDEQLTFNGSAGQLATVLVTSDTFIGGCGNLNVSILNPDGTTLAQANACSTPVFAPTTLPVGGVYTLVLASENGSTGAANVTLWVFQEQTSGKIASGTAAAVNISTPGQSDSFTFTGTAGQLATVQVSSDAFSGGCGNVNVSILNPDGTTLAQANACSNPVFAPVTLPAGGSVPYTVVISSQNGSTGTAQVTLWLFSNQTGTKITSGNPVTVTINTPGQSDLLTFGASAGQLADVQVPSASDGFTGGCGNVGISIISPDGTTLASANACGNPVFAPVTLPIAGTYTLVVSEGSGSLGSASVTLWLFKNQTGTKITSGSPVTVTISTPGQSDLLTFSGSAGQLADVQVPSASDGFTGGCGNVGISIISPDGMTLASANACGNPVFQPVPLLISGTYTLVVSEGSGSLGSASVTLWLFKEVTGPIIPGTPTSVGTNTPAQNVQLTFSGTIGQIVNLQLSGETFSSGSSCGNVSVSILSPSGIALAQANACSTPVFQNSITLPVGGIYTLLFAPQNASTATAVALLSETGAPTAAPTFSLAQGTYTTPQTVSLADVTPGAVIYYSTNGITPSTNSNIYTGPIAVSSTETVQAMALAPTYSQSSVASATYTIKTPIPPFITWATPADVVAGTALSSTQLDAAATSSGTTVSGNFAYTPAAGTVLTPGVISISVTFTPTDTTTYSTATATVYITVTDGTTTYDTGTVTLTVGGTVAATSTYGKGSTPSTVAQGLASGVTGNALVTVTAVDNAIYLGAKQSGSGTDYAYTLQTTTWDSKDFPQPSFVYSPVTGNLDGGVNTGASAQTVYSYTIPSSGYDGVGNLVKVTDSVMGTWSFQYDSLNRLAGGSSSSQPPAGVSPFYCWSYDPFGNRTNQAGSSAAFSTGSTANPPCQPASGATLVQTWATYNANNQITGTNQAPAGVLFDQSGNVVNDGLNRYLYDGDGRICAVASSPIAGTTIMTGYIYDAAGTRVSKGTITAWSCDPAINGFNTTNDYIVGLANEQFTEMAMNASGTMAWQHTNVWAGGKLLGTYDKDGLHFYFDDFLGTRRAQTDYAGVIEQTCSSLPFGDSLACTGSIQYPTEHHFTGKERDAETGNDYFGARYYTSGLGRWLSPDWAAAPTDVPYADFSDPQTINLYGFVRNNPLYRADLDGHGWPSNWPTGSQVADFLDAKIDAVVNKGIDMAVANESSYDAAEDTFVFGVGGDLAKGFTNVLRLGSDAGKLPSHIRAGDYLNAANDVAQEGARLVIIGGMARGAIRAGEDATPEPTPAYDRRVHYGDPSSSPAAKAIRKAGEGQPCPNCPATMRAGTKNAPTAEHTPTLKEHYYTKGRNMTPAERRAYARSPESMNGAVCKTCQSKQGAAESRKVYHQK